MFIRKRSLKMVTEANQERIRILEKLQQRVDNAEIEIKQLKCDHEWGFYKYTFRGGKYLKKCNHCDKKININKEEYLDSSEKELKQKQEKLLEDIKYIEKQKELSKNEKN